MERDSFLWLIKAYCELHFVINLKRFNVKGYFHVERKINKTIRAKMEKYIWKTEEKSCFLGLNDKLNS